MWEGRKRQELASGSKDEGGFLFLIFFMDRLDRIIVHQESMERQVGAGEEAIF
jgi:hypothetical protein